MKNDLGAVSPVLNKPKTAGELASALSILNGSIAPIPGVKEAYEEEVRLSAQSQPVQFKLLTAVCLQHQGLRLLLCKFPSLDSDQVNCRVLKLYSAGQARKFLASAGAHLPGSLNQYGEWLLGVFPEFPNDQKTIDFELVFQNGSHLKGLLSVVNLSPQTLPPLSESLVASPVIWKSAVAGAGANVAALADVTAKAMSFRKVSDNPYLGKVDGVVADRIEGWVWCPFKPAARYEVQAWSVGRLVGYSVANVWREDLELAKKGDGRVKFELNVSKALFDGQTHPVQLRVIGQGSADATMDFGKPLTFKSSTHLVFNPLVSLLMGYDLDQKLADSFAKKLSDVELKSLLLELMPKISMHLGDADSMSAQRLLEKILERDPQNGLALMKVAECHLLDGQSDKAFNCFDGVVKRSPKLLWAHLGKAESLRLLGKKEDAIKCFEDAVSISPEYPGLKLKLASLRSESLFDQEDHRVDSTKLNQVIEQMRQALLQSPGDLELVKTIARLEYKGDKHRVHIIHPDFIPDEVRAAQQNRYLLEACLGRVK